MALALHVNGGFANALENFREVVEHEVHGIHDVAERVVGHFAANGQVAARNFFDGIQQVGNAALEGILRLLVSDGMGDFRGAAVEILGDEFKFVAGFNLRARARHRLPRSARKISQARPRASARAC